MGKKRKKAERRFYETCMQQMAAQQSGKLGNGWGNGAFAKGLNTGLWQNAQGFLGSRSTSEQFLIGAVVGAAAAWLLTDEEMRGKLLKGAVRMYESMAGGLEEVKEQMADIRAELQAQESGD